MSVIIKVLIMALFIGLSMFVWWLISEISESIKKDKTLENLIENNQNYSFIETKTSVYNYNAYNKKRNRVHYNYPRRKI